MNIDRIAQFFFDVNRTLFYVVTIKNPPIEQIECNCKRLIAFTLYYMTWPICLAMSYYCSKGGRKAGFAYVRYGKYVSP